MKNDEMLKTYDSSLLSVQEHMLISPELADGLDDEETQLRVKAIRTLSATLASTPEGVAMPSADSLTERDIIDKPAEAEDTQKLAEEAQKLPLETVPLPAFQLRYITIKDLSNRKVRIHVSNPTAPKKVALKQAHSAWRRIIPTDKWLTATFILACIASTLSLWYFLTTQQTLLYGDAYAHLVIARRVFDNLTPGLAQLGGIWLPLPHVLMLPLVWNDFFFRTGLAGSIVSMLCYIIATIYIFLSARCLTKSSSASFIGTLVFILNPNILYLQSTPLSELVLMASLAATSYYFLVWSQTDDTKYLILTAGATFLATLARYDGWFVFLAILALIPLIGLVRRHRRVHIEGNLIIYASMSGLGIFLWFVWNLLIFNDPLYFQHGPFSAQAQQDVLLKANLLFTYHNLYESIRYYLIDCIDIVGPLLFGLGVITLLLFLVKYRLKPETLAILSLLSPILFYIISLYTGQIVLYLPNAVPGYSPYSLFNARYGEIIVMPTAIFLACLVDFFSGSQQRSPKLGLSLPTLPRAFGRYVFPLLCVGIILGQSLWIANTSVVTWEEGIYGVACTPTESIVIYLAEHYNGGKILEDLYTSKIDTLEISTTINFKNIIYEGSGPLWSAALSHPASVVNWIIVDPTDPQDIVANKINLNSDAFNSQFSFVLQEQDGVSLYLRNGLPPLPTFPVNPRVFTEHERCGENSPNRFLSLPGLPVSIGASPVPTTSTFISSLQIGQGKVA